jgi:hypothetical protein
VTPAPGVRGSRRALAALALVVALVALVAACGGTSTPSPSTSAPASVPAASLPAASDEPSPSGTEGPTATAEPTEAPTEPATEPPTEPPTEAPTTGPTDTPAPTASPGSAAACAGSDDNRAWFAGLARSVSWDLYCPVLPAGWFVVTGNYHLAGGGRMDITYRGPGGRRIEILEGAYCTGTDGCPQTSPDAGPASFGDRAGRLIDADGGDWLVVVSGGSVSWQAKGIGMDGPTLAGYTADFVKVTD